MPENPAADPVQEWLDLIDQRVAAGQCGCGCGLPLPYDRHGRQKYSDGRHRQRAYRELLKRRAQVAGVPVYQTLSTLPQPSRSSERNGDAEKPRKPPRKRRRSDVRVAFDRVAAALADSGAPQDVIHLALTQLREGLTDRQRELLDTTTTEDHTT